MFRYFLIFAFILNNTLSAQQKVVVKFTPVDSGWANNSVNTVIFRKNSLTTFKDTQYIAFYDKDQFVIVGKRRSGAPAWLLMRTPFKGNAADAHNAISMMVDGAGYLHLSWDHHGNPLNYCKSKSPGALIFTDKIFMTGLHEQKVTYPEFHKLPNGNLLFLYRDGASGKGNLVVNYYNIKTSQWTQLHTNLIDGQGQRNAYWQACVDAKGVIHLSWVWRESPDVASNHDMCYATSSDGGKSWSRSNGEKYTLPITAATAEYACRIPQQHELINQTSMFADAAGHPFIATYYKEKEDTVPQYHLIYKTGKHWQVQQLNFRKTPFTLSGAGTKRIPIARPQIIAWTAGQQLNAALIFRDIERGDKVTVALSADVKKGKWQLADLTNGSVGLWEPTYDTELWKEKGKVNLFIQQVDQVDGEGAANIPPQLIQVLEWDPSLPVMVKKPRNHRKGYQL